LLFYIKDYSKKNIAYLLF